MKKKLAIGIVGCGAIGGALTKIVKKELSASFAVVAFCDQDESRARSLLTIWPRAKILSLPSLVASCDLIVEAASAGVSCRVARSALSAGKSVLVMSVGGVLAAHAQLSRIARRTGGRFLLPSGAICGLDGIRALNFAGLTRVTLHTCKPPKALAGAPYLIKRGIDVLGAKKPKVVFSGTAEEAVRAFPQNINVVALLQLAAGPGVAVRVEIWAVPGLERNTHEIEVVSPAARLKIQCENTASPDNPKTSALAILSAAASLKGFSETIRIGS